MHNDIDAILAYLTEHLEPKRVRHTLAASRIAVELAVRNNVSPRKAVIAALLHDTGKGLSCAAMIAYVRKHKVAVPEKELVIKHHPSLLHSYISADIARRVFGVRDRETLEAIRNHTIGGAKMNMLSKIIYVSDAVSPDRRYSGIRALRRLSRHSVDDAMQMAMAQKLRYVIDRKEWMHPGAVRTWNAVAGRKKGTGATSS